MATELEDPFHGCSLISLLPKTLAAVSHAQIADSETDDPKYIQSLFKTMVDKGSTQIVQQAQTITKNKTNTHNLHPEDGSFGANCKDHQPERRPALGRKRAKFSLHPVPSHSVPKTDISSSIDHIDDPEEYFLAFEQLENAEKEVKKLRGEVYTDPFQHHQGTAARKRRPGLLGKTASYKHHTSANVETAEQESHLDSVDADPCNLFHSKPVDEPATSQAENTKNDLNDSTENEGSVAEKEEGVGNLLEALLSKYIDGDEGETFLRESLQIKPNDAGICRPSLPSIQIGQHGVFNNRTLHGELNNSVILSPSTKSLLQVTSALQRRSLKDPLKDLCPLFPGNDSPCSGGSCLSKSTGKESFSPVIVGNHNDCGFLLVGASSSLGFEDGANSPHAEADRFVGHNCVSEERLSKLPYPKLEGKTNPDIIAVGNENGHISDEFDGSLQQGNDVLLDHVIQEPDAELLHSDSQCRMQEIVDSPSQLLGEDANCDSLAGGKGKDVFGGLPVEGDNLQLDLLITNQPDAAVEFQSPIAELECSNSQRRMQEIVDNPSQLLGEDANCDSLAGGKGNDVFGSLPVEGDNLQLDLLVTNQPDAAVEFQSPTCANQTLRESLENPLKKRGGNNSSSVTDVEMSYPVLDDMSQFEVPVQEKVSDAETSKDNSSLPEVTALPDRYLENQHSIPDEYNEEDQIASGQPPNEVNTQEAPRPPRSKKNKSFTRRQSLAGGGTIWEDGRRRSSRRRFRPLEHWRGEKLLYGRVHSSLATVIGVKYASPGKNNLKVESCVSEEYAELVALAARC